MADVFKNVLIDNIESIAKLGLEKKVDWMFAYSMWIHDQQLAGNDPVAGMESDNFGEMTQQFLNFIDGKINADGTPGNGKKRIYKLGINGEVVASTL